jgi:hypothetical protein
LFAEPSSIIKGDWEFIPEIIPEIDIQSQSGCRKDQDQRDSDESA